MFDPATLALIALVMTFGGMVKGTIGLGLPLVSVGFLSIFLPVKVLLGIAILPILLTNLFQVYEAGGDRHVFKRWWPMIVCFWGGLAVGARLLVSLDPQTLYAVIGGLLIVFCVASLFRPDMMLPKAAVFPTSIVVGGLSGLSGGIATVWGPPVSMFMLMTGMEKEEFVKTIGVIWCAGAIPVTAFYVYNGVLGPHNVYLSLGMCVPALLGLWAGQRIRRRIPQDSFKKILMIALLVIGANLLRRAVSA